MFRLSLPRREQPDAGAGYLAPRHQLVWMLMPGSSRTQLGGYSSETEVLANDYSVVVIRISESHSQSITGKSLSTKYIQNGVKER